VAQRPFDGVVVAHAVVDDGNGSHTLQNAFGRGHHASNAWVEFERHT
jgi:hypothetical protein